MKDSLQTLLALPKLSFAPALALGALVSLTTFTSAKAEPFGQVDFSEQYLFVWGSPREECPFTSHLQYLYGSGMLRGFLSFSGVRFQLFLDQVKPSQTKDDCSEFIEWEGGSWETEDSSLEEDFALKARVKVKYGPFCRSSLPKAKLTLTTSDGITTSCFSTKP